MNTSYTALFRNRGFQSFLWTQFLGAFNDNVYKMIVSVAAVELAASQALGSRYLALAGAVFVIPFLAFAGYAGYIADRFSKTRVLQITKSFEIAIMVFGMLALSAHSINMLLIVLFLLAAQANFFSPAKYGILPEMIGEAWITKANGLLELTTFSAIVLGSGVGTLLFARWKGEPLTLGGILLAVAVAGSIFSIFIPRVPPAGSREPFRWNPFAEVVIGTRHLLADRRLAFTVAGISWFWFLGGLFQMAILLQGAEVLHLTEARIGLLVTALAAGIGAGSLAAGWVSGDSIDLGLVPVGAGLLGVCTIFTGMAVGFIPTLLWLAGAGFFGGLFIVPLNAWLQERANPLEKGRILTTNNFVNMVGVIAASGVLYLLHDVAHWSPGSILIALGIATLVASGYIAFVIPGPLLRFLTWCALKLFFRIRVVGAEHIAQAGGALIICNHVSYADAGLVGYLTPRFVRFLMWKPLYDNPWLNPLCRAFKAIPLPYGSPKESLRALEAARLELRAGHLVCIFPEGSITRTGHVHPFQRGVEFLLRRAEGTPVIPVYLDGMWGHMLSFKDGRFMDWRRFRFRQPITIYVGAPMTGVVTAQQIRDRVLELSTCAAQIRSAEAGTLACRFAQQARRHWRRTAIADSTGRQLTFGRLLAAALLFRDWLRREAEGECVGVLLPPCVAAAIANIGIAMAGKIAVNLNFTAGEEFMRHPVATCHIGTILSSRAFLEKTGIHAPEGTVFMEDILPSFSSLARLRALAAARLAPLRHIAGPAVHYDTAAIIFSSGTTGTPKGVMLSHWNLIANVEATAHVFSVGPADCMLGALPFFHSFGYTYTLWFPLVHGFKAVFHSNPTDARVIGDLAASHRATLLLSTPTFCMAYLRKCAPEQFASLRYLLVGAEKLRPALADSFRQKFGVSLLEGYGCTEMGPVVAVNGAYESAANRPGSVGMPLPGVSVRIVDPETLLPVAAGETGLLLVNGPSRMTGYMHDHERTAQSLDGDYYITGDLARLDDDGFLYIVDRLSRFSKIAGEMVPHSKVEEAIQEIIGYNNCVVTGIPDEQRGERLVALCLDTGLAPADIWRQLSETGLPRLWMPKRENFYRVESLPTLGTGKLDLRRIRQLALELAQVGIPQ